ncbi:MAG: lysozyme inhibitor LprI family protein [Vulcanimicrobiota bacterium]
MRYLLALLILLTVPTFAQNQHELNARALQDYEAADRELNQVWQELKPQLGASVREKLVDAQLIWIKYRDAEAKARQALYEGGSMAPMIYYASMATTTRARTAVLREWLEEVSH